jgi:hypothetical protein
MADGLEVSTGFPKPDTNKDSLVSKLEEMSSRGEFTPIWVAEIMHYLKYATPPNARLYEEISSMYEQEEWDDQIVDELKAYIRSATYVPH